MDLIQNFNEKQAALDFIEDYKSAYFTKDLNKTLFKLLFKFLAYKDFYQSEPIETLALEEWNKPFIKDRSARFAQSIDEACQETGEGVVALLGVFYAQIIPDLKAKGYSVKSFYVRAPQELTYTEGLIKHNYDFIKQHVLHDTVLYDSTKHSENYVTDDIKLIILNESDQE